MGGEGQAFAMQSCARCGFVVYPAEKINCIDQVTYQHCGVIKNCQLTIIKKLQLISEIFMWHIQIVSELMLKMVCIKSRLQSNGID